MRRLALCALAACAHVPPAPMTWPPLDAQLLADSAATFNFRLGLPAPLAITPDGGVLFRRTPGRAFAADLFELDSHTGAIKTLLAAGDGDEHLSDAEKARREPCSIARPASAVRSIPAAKRTIRTCRRTGRASRSCAIGTSGSSGPRGRPGG
jgi:hypothetical protein